MGKPKGFAAMTPERRKEIAAKGRAAVKPENRSFSKNRELAREAGRKGGRATGKMLPEADNSH
jgi:general stress protein YciG